MYIGALRFQAYPQLPDALQHHASKEVNSTASDSASLKKSALLSVVLRLKLQSNANTGPSLPQNLVFHPNPR